MDKINYFQLVVIALCTVVVGYAGYSYGARVGLKQSEDLCVETVKLVHEEDLHDCRKAIDTTINTCVDTIEKVCNGKTLVPERATDL